MTTKISSLVSSFLNDYINTEFPKFVTFMELYYKHLEVQGGVVDLIVNSQNYDDIDRTLDTFIPYFKKQYAEFFPDIALVDKRLLIKHIKDFYLAKGSEDAFKMFFQMVYNTKISLFLPSEHILRTSDGVYNKKIVIRVSKVTGDPFQFTGKTIQFLDMSSTVLETSFCESVQHFSVGNFSVYELVLNNKLVNFTYIDIANAVSVTATDGTNTYTANLYSMIIDSTMGTPGTGYSIGDPALISGFGSGAKISVSKVDLNTGAILAVSIDDFGVGYVATGTNTFMWGTNNLVWTNSSVTYQLEMTSSLVVTFPYTGSHTGTINAIIGKMGIFPSKFEGSSGWLSSDQALQDNYYYQIHSYVINSNRSLDEWVTSIKNNAHIAGSVAFNSTTLNSLHSVN